MFWLFSRYDAIDLQKVNGSVHSQSWKMTQICSYLIFLNIQMGLILIEDR